MYKVWTGILKKTLPDFNWTEDCQEGFDNFKRALTSAPILVYPDYSKPFILEMDASLKGLGAVLSQQSEDNTIRVIAYASQSFRPGEKSMKDYLSAKIELLALKWSVCEKFKDYLLGSKFTVYTDNNPLVYIKSSKLGTAQICWLSELALYDFDIIYRTGKSNLVADALSRRPETPSDRNNSGGCDSDEDWEAISYPVTHTGHIPKDPITITSQVISDDLNTFVGRVKIHNNLRECIEMVGITYEEMGEIDPINIQTHITEVFSQVTPEQMAKIPKGGQSNWTYHSMGPGGKSST